MIKGIQIERNSKGTPTYARISIKKYGARLMPFFLENGIILENHLLKQPVKTAKLPKGSVTSKEFWNDGFKIVNEMCNQYGIV
ncbi:MAG: hypothetical protein LBS50_11630 [Prevotellaceae bacterium]|jgi:hypothetical protein|nr:hypothetical protein [Prevotellaceae bacterium]